MDGLLLRGRELRHRRSARRKISLRSSRPGRLAHSRRLPMVGPQVRPRLWVATRSLVRGAEDTAARQLRAYVVVEPGAIFEIQPIIVNAGQTPAYEVVVILPL